MDASGPTPDPAEAERRKPGAAGTPAVLADGQTWLLANPVYRAGAESLTQPPVDGPLDRAFESAVLNESLTLCDVWLAGRALLKANYELKDDEVARLLTVSPGEDSRTLASVVLEALFGSERREKTYTAWVRASLLANGLGGAKIPAADVTNVLAILAATNRTIPLSRFADACRAMDERARLETLI
jgi:hypothetical protein